MNEEKDKDQESDKMRSLMIDHIEGNLTGELKKYVEAHVAKSKKAKKEYDQFKKISELMQQEEELEPDPKFRQKFLDYLRKEKQVQPNEGRRESKIMKIKWNTLYRIAAAVSFVVIAFLAGRMSNKSNSEMKLLRSELQETKELVLLSMMKQESASSRMKGVLASYEIDKGDKEIFDALIYTMNYDESVNVRIAAVEALGRFTGNEEVRSALISSLNNQEYPAVQISLIELLVKMGDKQALEPMQKMADDEQIMQSVRDQAQMGVFKLM